MPNVVGASEILFAQHIDNGGAVVNVRHPNHGALGDGVDDLAAIMAAIDSAPAGATIYLPPGDYRVSGAIRPRAGQTIMGAGASTRIMCPDAGWDLIATGTDQFGIITIKNAPDVRVTNLSILGTKTAAGINNTPKLIYLEGSAGIPLDGVLIDGCWLSRSNYEGIWQGGPSDYCRGLGIHNNRFRDVAQVNEFGGLPCIQLNAHESSVTGNRLRDVGIGISLNGTLLTVTGNVIRGVTSMGIQTGDSGPGAHGNWTISGNVVEFSEGASLRIGIQLDGGGGTNHLVNVVGNSVRLAGGGGAALGQCYKVQNPEHVSLVGNVAEITGRGQGFVFQGSTAGNNVTVNSNTVSVRGESAQCYGFLANPSAGTLRVRSSGNRVYGLSEAHSSYAYFWSSTGTGVLEANIDGDWLEGGYVLVKDVVYASTSISLAGRSFSHHSDLAQSATYHRAATLGMLNLAGRIGHTIVGDAISLAGTSASVPLRNTRIKLSTEGGAASDNLATISGGQDGDVVVLGMEAAGYSVAVQDGTGNLRLAGGFSLTNPDDRLMLECVGGTHWVELSRSDNR